MRNAVRRCRALIKPEITLTPLLDTALNLLIIFMITAPMIHNAIRVDLPRGSMKEDGSAPEELVVSIDKQQKFYLNGIEMTRQAILDELTKVVQNQQDQLVYIRADRDVSYGCVTELVDEMKQVEGVAHVALATQKA